jgi:glutathionylspermidine synthase
MKKTKIQKAVKTFSKALSKDTDFFNAYQANIAMQFKDLYSRYRRGKEYGYINNADVHKIANEAAASFLNLLILLSE